jgi:flagellin
MTRINTNVSSLVAQNRLQASNKDLQTALTRLSTGLRINSGSDDPAGLIASEALRSEITSLNKSISNTRRASQIISTADSALGQVSNLLNDIRGLVVEAANSGALSKDEIAANQLQVDSSLEAINRIAQTTTFQGRKLLDGSLDFITAGGTGSSNFRALRIDQASLGPAGSVDVNVNVQTAATQAALNVESFRETANSVTGVASTGTINFSIETQAAVANSAQITFGTGGDTTTLTITNDAAGATGDGVQVIFQKDDLSGAGNTPTAAFNVDGNIVVTITDQADTAIADIATAINSLAGYSVTTTTAGAGAADFAAADAAPATLTLTGGSDAVNDTATINITAAETGVAFNGTINITQNAGTTTPTVDFAGGSLDIVTNNAGSISVQSVVDAINADGRFTATRTGALTNYTATDASLTVTPSALAGGVDEQLAGAQADVVFELAGSTGSQVFNISAGTSLEQIVQQVNLVSDATGVRAMADGTQLQLRSSDYGSRSTIEVRVISQGDGGNFSASRVAGTDLVATVNGRAANGIGNQLSINTSTLTLSADMQAGFTGNANFTITGGGANFQLGPEVVTNQQARIGIGSVNSARLGGVAGKLFELGSGESASLATDPNRAAEIVTQAIAQVTGLRGRLGAFQATSLESNLVSLSDTVANLQEAESSIRDADFAAESAALTRAQILVQSGTNVLSLANQNPQNVLSLLR